jgi:hypothetical protein
VSGTWRLLEDLDIAFRTKALRTVCEDQEKALKVYCQAVVDALRVEIANLRAAESLSDIISIGSRVERKAGCLELPLASGYWLKLKPWQSKIPESRPGEPVWDSVFRVMIEGIYERTSTNTI